MASGNGLRAIHAAIAERLMVQCMVEVQQLVLDSNTGPLPKSTENDQDASLAVNDRDSRSCFSELRAQLKGDSLELDGDISCDQALKPGTFSRSCDCDVHGPSGQSISFSENSADRQSRMEVRLPAPSAASFEWNLSAESDPESDYDLHCPHRTSDAEKFPGALIVARARKLRRTLKAKACIGLGWRLSLSP
eukprot:TRINITY_DN15893_c0_g1_i1.p1 TRINITY_DN15893_c0_g1~~TRINITY_DN15893_c0_g1_i1.p1  ORF type:complete len:206 (+),score=19.99 TRINITY_DN15893_c0_g1_i1:45-620(+)